MERIFLNPDELTLEKNIFMHGIGSLVYSQNKKHILKDVEISPSGIYSNNLGKTSISDIKLYKIEDCSFIDIGYNEGNLFSIGSGMTLYIRSCTFQRCKFNDAIFKLGSNANTITHICCSELTQYGEGHSDESNDLALFLFLNAASGSFIKLIYSTFLKKILYKTTKYY